MPKPVVDPSLLPSREFRPLAPEDAQEASYSAASARIANFRRRSSPSPSVFMFCFFHSLAVAPRRFVGLETARSRTKRLSAIKLAGRFQDPKKIGR